MASRRAHLAHLLSFSLGALGRHGHVCPWRPAQVHASEDRLKGNLQHGLTTREGRGRMQGRHGAWGPCHFLKRPWRWP